jgi:hypothetical protein
MSALCARARPASPASAVRSPQPAASRAWFTSASTCASALVAACATGAAALVFGAALLDGAGLAAGAGAADDEPEVDAFEVDEPVEPDGEPEVDEPVEPEAELPEAEPPEAEPAPGAGEECGPTAAADAEDDEGAGSSPVVPSAVPPGTPLGAVVTVSGVPVVSGVPEAERDRPDHRVRSEARAPVLPVPSTPSCTTDPR